MVDYYLGEIRAFGGRVAPAGWHLCDGSYLSVAHDNRLFQLIGTTFGGDGRDVFRLPDLRGRVIVATGQGYESHNYVRGEMGGGEKVMLGGPDLPVHSHVVNATPKPATAASPAGAMLATPAGDARLYYYGTADVTDQTMAASTIGITGGTGEHDNIMPSLVINYIIALEGHVPSAPDDEAEEG